MVLQLTLERMLGLCVAIKTEIACYESAVALFNKHPERAEQLLKMIRELGSLAASVREKDVPDENMGWYLRTTGMTLQVVDVGIAYIFCKYDIDGFSAVCAELLESDV